MEFWPNALSLNAELCYIVACYTSSTGGDSVSVGLPSASEFKFPGASVFGTIGDTPPGNGFTALGCFGPCVGAFRNNDGGYGFAVGAGTPGLFVGANRTIGKK